jgi:soluble lytic murein transglycosylase
LKRLLRVCILFILAQTVQAEFSQGVSYSPSVDPDRYEERRRYLDALHLIHTNQFSKLKKVKPALRTYALYPYLEYTEMAYRISRYKPADIQAFTDQYADTPLIEPLVQHWLDRQAKKGSWQTFRDGYESAVLGKPGSLQLPTTVTPTKILNCHYGYSLYKTGQTSAAMQEAEKLWLVGFSQPDECDPIFQVWRGNGGITPEIAWERFSLSLKNGEKKLSNYLLRFIHKDDKSFASNYRLVHLKPRTLQRYSAFRRDHVRNREIILHGVKRLARSDPEAAVETLNRYATMHNFDPEALEETYASIGRYLAGRSDDVEATANLPVNMHNHPGLVEARLRQSLRVGDWRNVIVLTGLLPEAERDSARWQYWRARVLEQSAEAADRNDAIEIFRRLAAERSFYGFLSADIVGSSYSFEDEPVDVSLEEILALEQMPGIQRALELFSLGERSKARREWYFSTREFSQVERAIAARVALRWGWYKVAIQTMIDAGSWNQLDFRFPMAYQDNFIAHARRANIPVPWSLAIARQESAFMPDAKSSAGAMGVMQLMPGTAKLVANRIGARYQDKSSLTEPDFNIKLGTHYLGQMLRRFDNNRILASAAYNAGPGRVERWNDPALPFDVWIEVIPFTETRNYVQNVLMFSNIYSRRMQESPPLIYEHERSYFSDQQITVRGPAGPAKNS